MIGKRYLAQKIEQSSSSGVKSLSSLFHNTITASSTQTRPVQRQIKATKGKPLQDHSSDTLPGQDESSPHKEGSPTHVVKEQDLPGGKRRPCEEEKPPEIEPASEAPLDVPPEGEEDSLPPT